MSSSNDNGWRGRRGISLIMMSVAISLLTIYLALAALAFFAQRGLIYPSPAIAQVPKARSGSLLEFDAGTGRRIVVYYSKSRMGQKTVVIFHGNAEQLADQATIIDALGELGIGAYAVEYPGYGLCLQSKATEQNIYADAAAALGYLSQQLQVPREQVVLLGRSLGTGVAIEMAAWGFGSRLILLSPYTSMVDLARRTLPIFPVSSLVLDRYDNLKKSPRVKLPTLIAHGALDSIIPVAMGQQLARRLPSAVMEVVPQADHNDLLEVGGTRLWNKIVEFVRAAS